MFNKLKIGLIASPLLVLSSGAFAVTISNVIVTETTIGFGGPPSSSVSYTDSTTDGDVAVLGNSGTSAEQNGDGTSDVEAVAGIFFALEELTTAEAQFTQIETNIFAVEHDYFLSFELEEQSADLYRGEDFGDFAFTTALNSSPGGAPSVANNPFASDDPTVITTSDFTAASFQYEITVNGATVFDARADGLIDDTSQIIDAGSLDDFNASFTALGFGGWNFKVDAISMTDMFIGSFDVGETFNVVSTLTAQAYVNNSELLFQEASFNFVNTFSSDPVKLASIGFLTSAPTITGPTPVPEPSAIALLGAGVIAFGVVRRKKRKLV